MMNCLIETSFEICNKVGGIYTVVSSKAALLKERYDEYYLIGPYVESQAVSEFREESVPPQFQHVLSELASQGIHVKFGTWLIAGEPSVFLLDFQALLSRKDEFKKLYWDNFSVDSLNAGFDFDEPLVFSTAAGMLIEKIKQVYTDKQCISHTHEWMTGFTNLYLKAKSAQVATVFTTHATMLGRAMSGSGENLYQHLEQMNPEQEAKRKGVYEKFTAERACAQFSDVFTTVSEITAKEAEHILGRKPDVLVLNGLNTDRFPTFEQLAVKRAESKNKINEFLQYFFFPYQSFDIHQSTVFFISGRHEVHNKGVDVTLQTLGKLNEELKHEHSTKTVICFIWVPYQTFGVKKELLENKINFRRIKNYIQQDQQAVQESLLHQLLSCESENVQFTFPPEFIHTANILTHAFNRNGTVAPLTTHYLEDEEENEVIRLCRMNGLHNQSEDRVKIVYYPVYLTGVDSLLDLAYYDATLGCELGLFASYYEPWGYTPPEGASVGVPVVTTDLAGYGKFMVDKCNDQKGIFVMNRLGVQDSEFVASYVKLLKEYVFLSDRQKVTHKIHAKLLSEEIDWKKLVDRYTKAHKLALERGKL